MGSNMKKYSINGLPKAMNVILAMFPLLGLLTLTRELDNDSYFLFKMGEYICNEGLPSYDILSMHGEMELVVQQWLCDVVFYKIYDFLGTTGLILFVVLAYIVFITLFYKLCKMVSNNFFISIILTTISGLCLSITYFTTRPQIVTYIVFVLLFYALESYIKTKKKYWLIILPLLSLLLINWHASMWWLLFVFMLPYLAASVPIKSKKINQIPCCNIFLLIVTMLVMFGVGFINPYGVDAVTYLFGSYGISEINEYIQEMHAVSISEPNGKVLLVLMFVFVIVFALKKVKNINVRFVLLTLGTLILALSSLKGIAYFLICGFFSMAYFLKDFDFEIKVTESKRTKKEKIKLVSLVCIFVVLLVSLGFVLFNGDKELTQNEKKLENLNEIVQVLDEEPKEDIVLYGGFNTGQYLEFRGYKPYIDGRAEVFLKKNNKSFDYFKEYVKMTKGEIYYKDFVDKYEFTYLVVDNYPNPLREGLSQDKDYSVVNENDDFILYKLNDR